MTYHQLTSEERYMLSALRRQGLTPAQIARHLGRHRSTIGRELKRNSSRGDGFYRPSKAIERTAGRRSRSRRNQHSLQKTFIASRHCCASNGVPNKCRGSCAVRDACGSATRPSIVTSGTIDSVVGTCMSICAAPASGSIASATAPMTVAAGWPVSATFPSVPPPSPPPPTGALGDRYRHDRYPAIERALRLQFYFATPHHAWERGTNENTNGLIRQYLPKRTSMAALTQHPCNVIAHKLNTRPRKRLDYQTPEECFYAQ
jgi:hypothetical protein